MNATSDICTALGVTAKPAVLIVDDEVPVLQVLSSIFMRKRPTLVVETCPSARVAAQRLAEGHYDTVITDLAMPELSGWEMLARVRETRPCTPLLVMTGTKESAVAERAFEQGAFDFIGKPIDWEGLMWSVTLAVKTHRLRRRMAERQVRLAQLREVLHRRWTPSHAVRADATEEHSGALVGACFIRRIEAAVQPCEKAIERIERILGRNEDAVRRRARQRLLSS